MSMLNIQRDDVYGLARAARLAITEDEAQAVYEKIQGISQMIEEMRCLDTTGVEPMTHVPSHAQPLRNDEVKNVANREHWQECAPLLHEGFYLVPQVIE
ncbi:MAG: Asp-tRNA(Asn)/Glu-tRNA(Gln) amidotransferase subunit GatC [Pseudomonadota bacterium]